MISISNKNFPLDLKLSQLVGKHGGVVHAVQNVTLSVDDPQIYFSLAIPNNPKIFQPEMDGLIVYVKLRKKLIIQQ